MEASGKRIWRLVRPRVVQKGALKTLRAIRCDPEEAVDALVERRGSARLFRQLGIAAARADRANIAFELLKDLAVAGRPIPVHTRAIADEIALSILDAWATLGDDPGAEVAGAVVALLGKRIARMEFDSGSPGSGQLADAYQLDDRIFLVNAEYGAYGISRDVRQVLREWVAFENADIRCSQLRANDCERLGLTRCSEPNSASHKLRINGRWWLVGESALEQSADDC